MIPDLKKQKNPKNQQNRFGVEQHDATTSILFLFTQKKYLLFI